MQIDLRRALENLKNAEIIYTDENEILKDVANNNSISSQQLYSIMRLGSEEKIIKIPDIQPLRTGKKTIQIFCEQHICINIRAHGAFGGYCPFIYLFHSSGNQVTFYGEYRYNQIRQLSPQDQVENLFTHRG